MGEEPRLLWEPSAERIERAAITAFARAVGVGGSYAELWRWSVEDIERFWAAIWDHFGVEGAYDEVLGSHEMPGAEWFPGTELSYAEHIFRGRSDEATAIHHASETRELAALSWGELREQTARIRTGLLELGVGRGRPRLRLPAEHPRDDRGVFGLRLDRGDLVLGGP